MSKSKGSTAAAPTTATPNGLIPVVQSSLPVATQDAGVFDNLAKSANFLGRLQLYSKGKLVAQGKIKPGSYGIPEADDKITALGETVDILVLARRAKALDISDTSDIVQNFDPNSDEFNRIAKASETQDSGCMFGVSFLVYVPKAKRFLEYFAGTKSARGACGDLFPFLPENQPQEATSLPTVSFSARFVEKGNFSWHIPVFQSSSTPVDAPSQSDMQRELTSFLNPSTGPETVTKEEAAAAGGGRAR